MKYRIFISSVQGEFTAERRNLKDWLTSDAVLSRFVESVFIFEDVPSRGVPPVDSFLDEVRKAHIYVGLLGERYSGTRISATEKSATEIEYDCACENGLERLVFVKKTDARDSREKAFVERISGEVVRRSFENYWQLKEALYASLADFLDRRGVLEANDFDKTQCRGARFSDLSRERIDWFIDEANRLSDRRPYSHDLSTEDFLEKINLMKEGALTNAAVLLFGRDPQRFVGPACVKCVWCEGVHYSRPFLDTQILKGDIFSLIEQSVHFVKSRLARSRGIRDAGLMAPTRLDLPEEAIEEAITNAVIHRDYRSHGSVEIRLFADRLEILNPGRLPEGLTLRALYESHGSFPVNWLLCEVLNRTSAIESLGSGIQRMVDSCRAANVPIPEFMQHGPSFGVTLRMDMWTEARIVELGLSERQRRALDTLKRMGRITSAAYARMVSIGQKTAVRDLADMERKGVVNGVGKARGRYFVLRTNTDTNGTNRTHGSVREKFVCRGSVVDAHGSTGPGSPFVVLRGSVVSSGMMPSLKSRTPSYYKLRCGLEKDGTIVNGVFTRDFEFASPSAASSVVTGRPSNGRLDWMTTDGRSLKVVQEEWRT